MTSPSPCAAQRGRLRILRRPSESIRPAMPRPQRRDCQGQLTAALLRLCDADASLVAAGLRPWCSATFIGAQHQMTVRIAHDPGLGRAEALARTLPEAELVLRGHIVADVAIDAIRGDGAGGALIDLAVLTIEDW
jgi:hypothetical protein